MLDFSKLPMANRDDPILHASRGISGGLDACLSRDRLRVHSRNLVHARSLTKSMKGRRTLYSRKLFDDARIRARLRFLGLDRISYKLRYIIYIQ